MISISNYKIYSVILDELALDGGAMFGAVPKTLWQKDIPSDEKNRIQLASRSLVLEGNGRKILIDLGCGELWTDKEREIFSIINRVASPLKDKLTDVTDVILTHLHFDHAGGLFYLKDSNPVLNFESARYWLSEDNFQRANNPGLRERVSYRKIEIDALKLVNLNLLKQGEEIAPGVSFELVNGHTKGLICPTVREAGKLKLIFLSDLCPTASHLRIPYVMGYDLLAEVSMTEKERILSEAHRDGALVVFQHDLKVSAAYLGKDQKGNFYCEQVVELDKSL